MEQDSAIRSMILQHGSLNVERVLKEMRQETNGASPFILAKNGKANGKVRATRNVRSKEQIAKDIEAVFACIKTYNDKKTLPKKSQVMEETGLDTNAADRAVRKLKEEKRIKTKGKGAFSVYIAVGDSKPNGEVTGLDKRWISTGLAMLKREKLVRVKGERNQATWFAK